MFDLLFDMISWLRFKLPDPNKEKWQRFLETHREYIHGPVWPSDSAEFKVRKNTHVWRKGR